MPCPIDFPLFSSINLAGMGCTSLEEIRDIDPAFRQLIDYWRSLIDSDAVAPCAADFDLMAVYPIAPFLALVDVFHQTAGNCRYRWRFAGTGICHITGVEITNMWVDEFVSDEKSYAEVRQSYDHAVEGVEHDYWVRRIRIKSSIHAVSDSISPTFDYRRLSLPLLDAPDGRVSRLVSCYRFSDHLTEAARDSSISWIFADGGEQP